MTGLQGAKFRRVKKGLTVAIVVLAISCAGGSESSDEILVFSATSLGEVLEEVIEEFEGQSHVEVLVSYGASQVLAQQIASGAPADVFISAGDLPMIFLETRGALDSPSVDLLMNTLVVVVRSQDQFEIDSLADLATDQVERVAIADPELAPAGSYARESLKALGLWDSLQPKLVFGGDVRTALAFVETGNADAAIVYVTDARDAPGIEALDVIPKETHSPIRYPAGILSELTSGGAAREFMDFLTGDVASEIFRRHGFQPAG